MKRQDAPVITASMRIALRDLHLDHLTVLYPGNEAYDLGDRITVIPLSVVAKRPQAILGPKRQASRA